MCTGCWVGPTTTGLQQSLFCSVYWLLPAAQQPTENVENTRPSSIPGGTPVDLRKMKLAHMML